MAENPVKRGRGRPREGAERRVSLSVYVPESTAARIRSHAAHTGLTVSDVVSAILSRELEHWSDPAKFRDPPKAGGYDPETGSY